MEVSAILLWVAIACLYPCMVPSDRGDLIVRRVTSIEVIHPTPRPLKLRPRRAEPLPNALSYTVEDACCISGVGKTTLYRLINEGALRASKAAGRTLILGDSLRSLLTRDEQA